MEPPKTIEPIVKTLKLNASCDKAFRHFTDNIHLWWPLDDHSLSEANAATVNFEARPGGRIFEIEKSGKEREWGRVADCQPPHRVVFSWVLEEPANATEIELTFEQSGDGCEMTLIHRGWEGRKDGETHRNGYDTGWDGVLGAYTSTLG